MTTTSGVAEVIGDIKVIDTDTHLTEPHDLWRSRAPKGWEERVPQVREVKGHPTWVLEGATLGRAGGAAVVRRDGSKSLTLAPTSSTRPTNS